MLIRKATQDDCAFIARMVMTALHMEIDEVFYTKLCDVARREDTLYSWKRSMIAEVDGNLAGLCLAYDAAHYHEMRTVTFSLLPHLDPSTKQQADEAGRGEFYIDSLAVMTEYRNSGIGSSLLLDAIERARDLSLTPTLLVDPDNVSALNLYRRMGFHYSSEQFAFGMMFQKWNFRVES